MWSFIPSRDKERAFFGDDAGNLTIFSLFMLVSMLLMTGLAVDLARYESARTKVQNTLDRATLAGASLEQTHSPEDVVRDYMERAGMEPQIQNVVVQDVASHDGTVLSRSVQSTANLESRNLFMRMVGHQSFEASQVAMASERTNLTEVSLVLDMSSSMLGERMTALIGASNAFVDRVMPEGQTAASEQLTAINVVPFQMNVNLGQALASHYTITNEHDYSDCTLFDDAAFSSTGISTATEMRRFAHFDDDPGYFYDNGYQQMRLPLCPRRVDVNAIGENQMQVMVTDPAQVKSAIANLYPYGATGIDHGLKWGVGMLDPVAAPVITSLIASGHVDGAAAGLPMSHGTGAVSKVVVLMSDGGIDGSRDLHPALRGGVSNVWYDEGSDVYSVLLKGNAAHVSITGEDRSGEEETWLWVGDNADCNGNCLRDHPSWDGADSAENDPGRHNWNGEITRLDHADVFDRFRLEDYNSDIYTSSITQHLTAAEMDIYRNPQRDQHTDAGSAARLQTLCNAAAAQGITIYAIAFDAESEADRSLMANCASAPSFFYDVTSGTLDEAFLSIANNIKKLRLTM